MDGHGRCAYLGVNHGNIVNHVSIQFVRIDNLRRRHSNARA